MIGRGCYGKPWLLKQIAHWLVTGEKIPAPTLEQQRDIVLEHYEETLSHYGVYTGSKMIRKHIGWYTSGLHDSARFGEK